MELSLSSPNINLVKLVESKARFGPIVTVFELVYLLSWPTISSPWVWFSSVVCFLYQFTYPLNTQKEGLEPISCIEFWLPTNGFAVFWGVCPIHVLYTCTHEVDFFYIFSIARFPSLTLQFSANDREKKWTQFDMVSLNPAATMQQSWICLLNWGGRVFYLS